MPCSARWARPPGSLLTQPVLRVPCQIACQVPRRSEPGITPNPGAQRLTQSQKVVAIAGKFDAPGDVFAE
jgi:hypothetical protein